MNADVLLEHFHRLGEAPEAVARLRRFILDLAVKGKLVGGALNPDRSIAWVSFSSQANADEEGERPFRVPGRWRWGQMATVADCRAGAKVAPSSIALNAWVLDLEDIDGETGSVIEKAMFSDRSSKSTKASFDTGDVLYGKLRPYLNKVIVADGPGYCTTEIIPIRPKAFLSAAFLRYFLRSAYFLHYAAKRNYGMKMPRLGTKDLEGALVPVPPPEEQQRIVAKVDELMALCDRLEAAQQRREQHRSHLTAATWQDLVSETEPETTQFALAQLPALTTRKEQIAALRQTILDLAVRGRLVKQDERDEPAEVLLKRIAKEKAAYQTGRKKEFRVDPLTDEELRFALPSSWTWARTNDVTVYVQRGKSPKYSLEKKIPVIAQKCVQWADFQLEKAQFIEPASLSKYGEERYVQDGDLLWNSTGHGSLGRLIVFRERFKGKYPIIVADSHVTVIRASKHINPDYLFCWFAGPLVQDEINDKSTGTTNQTELPVGTVLAYDVPLPPFPEQQRIVAKVDELMALCDRLEAALEKGEAAKARLLEAVLAVATSSAPPPPQVRQHPAATKTKPQQATYPEPEEALPLAAEPVPRRRGPGRPRKAETQDLGTVAAAITGFLQAHPGWHARSAIVPGAGIAASAWNAAINALLEAGKVERQGAKKGARYRVTASVIGTKAH